MRLVEKAYELLLKLYQTGIEAPDVHRQVKAWLNECELSGVLFSTIVIVPPGKRMECPSCGQILDKPL